MRLRTGHGPADWSDNLPGGSPHRYGGYIQYGGSLVIGGPGAEERQRQANKRHNERKIKSQYPSYGQLCGAQLVKAGGMCGRGLGHQREHRTAESLELERERKRKGPRVAV